MSPSMILIEIEASVLFLRSIWFRWS